MPLSCIRRSLSYSLLAAVPVCLALALGTSHSASASSSSEAVQKKSSAHDNTQMAGKTQIVRRQNLRPVNHIEGESSDARFRVGIRNLQPSDVIVNRNASESIVEPLTKQAVLRSEVAFVQDLESSDVLYDKNSDEVRPIASISKLMTALVVAEAGLPMKEILEITDADVDRLRYSRSRLSVGTELSRADMLHLALMSSENRAAHALGRHYPGGMPAFVRAMNDKARALGMRSTHFAEPTGLSSDNVSSPRDLVKLLQAVNKQPLINRYTTDDRYEVNVGRGRQLVYNNTNRLVRNADWDIKVSKTGFINEAGECLVMLTRIDDRDVAIVLLNSSGRYSRIGDAVRIRSLVESGSSVAML